MVEPQPETTDGIEKFYEYVMQELSYPVQARQLGIEGKVFVQFVVNEYGEITHVKTLKSIGAGCDAEAERVLKNAKTLESRRNQREICSGQNGAAHHLQTQQRIT